MSNKDSWLSFPSHLDPPAIRSLSLVFILQELIELLEVVQGFQISFPSLSQDLTSFFSLDHSYPQVGMRPDKLCFYCGILLQASKIGESSLQNELDKMRIRILQCRSQLYPYKGKPFVDSQCISPFLEIYRNLCSFFTTLIPFLREARTDENVLLALIERRRAFNRHLGSCAIEKILQDFFPSGHAHLKAVISEGLTRRGFTSFFAEKEPLIDEIAWETGCHTT